MRRASNDRGQVRPVLPSPEAHRSAPQTPIANIYVKSYLNTEYNAKDLPLITPDCKSIGELDEWINSLIRDLETVRLEARTKFCPYEKRRGKSQIGALPASRPS